MNSNYGKSTKSSSFDFDLGLGSNRSRPLNDQKNQTSSYPSSAFASTISKPSTTPSWQPRPSYTHQPAADQTSRPGMATASSSMVGDIFGKSWGTTSSANSNIGIVNKNPNLFGDLVGSALGQNKGNQNAPLKNATPASAQGFNKDAFSMGNMAGSLPKMGNTGGYTGGNNGSNSNSVDNTMKNVNLGGPSMRNLGRNGGGSVGMGSSKDPFRSLVDFGSKPAGNKNSAGRGNNYKSTSGDDAFGSFQNAPKSSLPEVKSNFVGSNSGSFSNLEDFAVPTAQNQPPVQSSGADVFDSLFSASSASVGGPSKGTEGFGGSQQFCGVDDWGMDSEFGGGNDNGGTTELEGLPPPPAGVSASAAKSKGMDNYKGGHYADAIKWLSWAVILLEKVGDAAAKMDVLSSRASCYKEVGEYKKAVADCTKVLEHDGENVAVLVQRALLYESMEKYKLGAEDLTTVMKLDPTNRVARSTIHRLKKMAE